MIFRIYSFKYSTEWGGVMVLYKLANDLIRLGHVVNMFDYDKKNIDNPFCNTYLETNAEENEIVIYPEIVKGNPLHAKRVVRWILCDLGKNCSNDILSTWSKSDFVYHFSSYNTSIQNNKLRVLFTMKLEEEFYNKNLQRTKTCFTIRKAHKFHTELKLIHPDDSIEIIHASHSELVTIFNTSTYFYCYDPYTYLAMMAAACGCIPIVIPIEGIDKLSWLNTLHCASYMEEKGLTNIDGIAYGISDIDYAKTTIDNARKQQDLVVAHGFETVIRFVKDMETHSDSSSVYWNVKNIYNNSTDHIDHVLYINLDHRKDKREFILNECKRLGITLEKMTRIDAIYTPTVGMLGCSLSHCKALELALSQPEWTWTLILEDDIKFNDSPWLEINDALKNAKPDVLMLARGSCQLVIPTHPSSTNLYRVIKSCVSAAYVVHRNYIPKLLKNIRESIEEFTKPGGNIYHHPHDVYWYSIQKTDRWYTFEASVAWQPKLFKSDIR